MEPGIYELIISRARQVIDATPMSGRHTANSLWGREFRELLAGGEDLFILDLRDKASYEAGHIEGSAHLNFKDWASPENLDRLPRGRKIAVICETGDKASQVTSGLRLLGYEALAVKTGMHGYAKTVATDELAAAIRSAGRPVRRKPPVKSWPQKDGPIPFEPPNAAEHAALLARATTLAAATPDSAYFDSHIIHADQLHDLISDPKASPQVFLLDLRREEDFEGVGHIPGAVQVDFEHALSDEALALLPAGAKIIIICYTGNLAAQLTTMLRLLGHDAAVLANGMVQWTRTPTAYQYLKDIETADGALVVR